MISSLSILNHVEMDSDQEVLRYGISLILLNVGMYFVALAVVIIGIRMKRLVDVSNVTKNLRIEEQAPGL